MSAVERARAALAEHRAPTKLGLTTPVNFFVRKRNGSGKNATQSVWKKADYDDALEMGKTMHHNLLREHQQNQDPIRTAKETHLGLVYLDDEGQPMTAPTKSDKPQFTAPGETRSYRRTYGHDRNEELKRIMEVYIFAIGEIGGGQIKDILDGSYGGGAYDEARKGVTRYQSEAQNATLNWFDMVLTSMLKYWGKGDIAKGLEHWSSFAEDERSQFLVDRLEEAPELILSYAFPREANSINFPQIWCHHDKKATQKWRDCVRTKFVSLAYAVIDYRLSKHSASKYEQSKAQKQLADFWKVHMNSEVFDEFELGCRIDNVPTYASRDKSLANAQLKRAKVPKIKSEAELVAPKSRKRKASEKETEEQVNEPLRTKVYELKKKKPNLEAEIEELKSRNQARNGKWTEISARLIASCYFINVNDAQRAQAAKDEAYGLIQKLIGSEGLEDIQEKARDYVQEVDGKDADDDRADGDDVENGHDEEDGGDEEDGDNEEDEGDEEDGGNEGEPETLDPSGHPSKRRRI